MKNFIALLITILFNINVQAASSNDRIQITETGLISCFPENTKTNLIQIKEPLEIDASCEPSAVVYHNQSLIFGNDKTIENKKISSIFSLEYKKGKFSNKNKITYYTHPNIFLVKKFEDFAQTLDKKYILATTAFDREDDNLEYNSVIYWNSDNPNNVNFLQVKENEQYSRKIKYYLQKAINKPYFKIEGLVIIPNNKLIFGVREEGESYKNFKNVVHLISVSIFEENSKLYLSNDFKLVYAFENSFKYVKEKVGISSLTWNPYNNSILLLTSFEAQEKVGAYLWELPLSELEKNNDLKILLTKENKPLLFTHKAEGITFIDKNKLFVIHDDDRRIIPAEINNKIYLRKPYEAIYNIITFE